MSRPEESFQDLSERGYPTREEVEAVWFKLIVQPRLLEEVRRARRTHPGEAARAREAALLARAALTGRREIPASHPTSFWSRIRAFVGRLFAANRGLP